MVYILSGKVQQIMVEGINFGAQTSVYLPVGRNIAIQYRGKLSWSWQRVT